MCDDCDKFGNILDIIDYSIFSATLGLKVNLTITSINMKHHISLAKLIRLAISGQVESGHF